MTTTLLDKDEDADRTREGGVGEAAFFRSRNVIITGQIDDKLAARAVTQLLALAEQSDDPINLFISSPGGHVESGDMVHDIIGFIRPRVRCIGSGWVASAGALIFVGGKLEDRYCLPNTRFLLHQPSGAVQGQASDIEIQVEQIQIMTERFNKLFAEATGQTEARIAEDTRRDFWLKSEEAVEYGLVGQIIRTVDELR